jgi:hypothetical protein
MHGFLKWQRRHYTEPDRNFSRRVALMTDIAQKYKDKAIKQVSADQWLKAARAFHGVGVLVI